MNKAGIIHGLLAVLLSPLLLGVVNRTKTFFAGRAGAPVGQVYYDLFRLLGKGAVYSRTTTGVFRAGPMVGLACVIAAITVLPLGGLPAIWAFPGDFVLLAGLLGLMRFGTVLAALDTGSSFEGMGASREVQFSAIAEPVLLLILTALARGTGALSLTSMGAALGEQAWAGSGTALVLLAAALVVVLLVENARIPVDDPNTHLELTMIHEVMVLDHSGPDLAFILEGSALKLWVLAALLVGVALPLPTSSPGLNTVVVLAGMFAVAIAIGVIESAMARLALLRVPQFIVGAGALAALALVLIGR